VRDPSAGGRRALLLTAGGAARGRVRLAAAARLTVLARGSACAGAPKLSVALDGRRVLAATVRSRRRWSVLRAAAPVKAGTHAITLRLANPHRGRRCRRALRVDRLVFAPAPRTVSGPGTRPGGRWAPAPGTSWQWQLTGPLDLSVDADMYDIDLFGSSPATVAALHRRGRHVVCYLDAGTYEPGRPDAGDYPQDVLGTGVTDWPGERWLDVRRLDVLRPIIEQRLDLCRDKGFDAVEPDNMDAFDNDSGFAITADEQLAFNRFVASAARARGLSVGLKNDLGQVPQLVGDFDWALAEQCFQYRECTELQPFAAAGKAVFVAEYELDPATFCDQAQASAYSAMRKHLELDAWRQPC
jgi:hypothetical protein